MDTNQLIALLQSLDPSGTKRIKFKNLNAIINPGEEVDIVGGSTKSNDLILNN